MNHWLEFKLPQDADRLSRAMRADDYQRAVQQILNHVDMFGKIDREKFIEIMRDHNINAHEEVGGK